MLSSNMMPIPIIPNNMQTSTILIPMNMLVSSYRLPDSMLMTGCMMSQNMAMHPFDITIMPTAATPAHANKTHES